MNVVGAAQHCVEQATSNASGLKAFVLDNETVSPQRGKKNERKTEKEEERMKKTSQQARAETATETVLAALYSQTA